MGGRRGQAKTWYVIRGRIPGVLLFLGTLLVAWPQLESAEKSTVSPWSFTLRAEGDFRYDDNILTMSESDINRFESDPAYRDSDRFKIDTVDDFIFSPFIGATFRRSPRGKPETSFGASLRAYDYFQNSVKTYHSYGVWFRQELSTSRQHGTILSGGFYRTPDYYLRELIDDDESLAAGVTIRNSLTYDLNLGYLEVSQEIVNRILDFSFRYALERRNYNDHFNERDSNSTLYITSMNIYPLKKILFRIKPYYALEYRTSHGNVPASPLVDDDVGFDSDLYGAELRWLWGPDLDHSRTVTLWYEKETRNFTTDVTTDVGHYGRVDHITQYWAGYDHELNGNWQLGFAYRHRLNDSSTPDPLGGTTTTPFAKNVLYAGVAYRFNYPQNAASRTRTPRAPREPDQR